MNSLGIIELILFHRLLSSIKSYVLARFILLTPKYQILLAMNQHSRSQQIPAPCIVDIGTIINKDDIKRLLNDLCHVYYVHSLDNKVQSEGQGCVIEVFNDPLQSTLVANSNLYINIQSFDFLQLNKSPNEETCFDLIQDNRQLRLIPISHSSPVPDFEQKIDTATIEAMMTEVLSAHLDVQFDDDEF